jgi:hypothetical protein
MAGEIEQGEPLPDHQEYAFWRLSWFPRVKRARVVAKAKRCPGQPPRACRFSAGYTTSIAWSVRQRDGKEDDARYFREGQQSQKRES